MIVEERMYTLHVGKVPEFMEVYEKILRDMIKACPKQAAATTVV